MSSTRRATEGSPLRQERFASSPEFERGLMANLVARRCSVLDRPEDRELIWFLQLLSHREAGLKQLASDLCASHVRVNTVHVASPEYLDLHADLPPNSSAASMDGFRHFWTPQEHLQRHLASLCLNPALQVTDGEPVYFPKLVSTLREYQAEWTARQKPAATTSIGKQVFEALDYALESRRLVLVDGLARIGKSFGAKAWCAMHPGRSRYVEVHPMNDESGFFRAIALALGVSIETNAKVHRLRDKIEEVLLSGDLLLCLDEAHRLWPQTNVRERFPTRINWLMSLCNQGVPIALVTTPQFLRSQKEVEQRTCWTSEQFIGRIGHYQQLAAVLTGEDLEAVAEALLPDGDARSIEVLVLYAQSSAKYLAGIDTAIERARFLAKRDQRCKVTFADIKSAIAENVIPSDSAFASAMQAVNTPARRRAVRVSATPVQPSFSEPEMPAPVPRSNRLRTPGSRLETVRMPELVEASG